MFNVQNGKGEGLLGEEGRMKSILQKRERQKWDTWRLQMNWFISSFWLCHKELEEFHFYLQILFLFGFMLHLKNQEANLFMGISAHIFIFADANDLVQCYGVWNVKFAVLHLKIQEIHLIAIGQKDGFNSKVIPKNCRKTTFLVTFPYSLTHSLKAELLTD